VCVCVCARARVCVHLNLRRQVPVHIVDLTKHSEKSLPQYMSYVKRFTCKAFQHFICKAPGCPTCSFGFQEQACMYVCICMYMYIYTCSSCASYPQAPAYKDTHQDTHKDTHKNTHKDTYQDMYISMFACSLKPWLSISSASSSTSVLMLRVRRLW
jgi:hypothetical protein